MKRRLAAPVIVALAIVVAFFAFTPTKRVLGQSQGMKSGSSFFSWLGGPHVVAPSPIPTAPSTPVVISAEAFYGNFNLTAAAAAQSATYMVAGDSGGLPSNTGIDQESGEAPLATPAPIGSASPPPGNSNAFVPGMGDFNGALTWSDGAPDASNGGQAYHWSMSGLNNGFSVTMPGSATSSTFNTVTVFTSAFCAATQMIVHASDGTFSDQTDAFGTDSNTANTGGDFAYNVQYRTNSSASTVTLSFTDTNASECSGKTGAIAFRGELYQPGVVAAMPVSGPVATAVPSPTSFPNPSPTPTSPYNETPGQSDAFVSSIGINTRWSQGGLFHTDAAQLQALLEASGVRHIRDGIGTASTAAADITPLQAYGVTVSQGGFAYDTTQSQLLATQTALNGMIDQFEPANEPDGAGDADWIARSKAQQIDIYNWVHGNAGTTNIPVIGPALISRGDTITAGNIGNEDDCNLHNYNAFAWPEGTAANAPGGAFGLHNPQSYQNECVITATGEPVETTEDGYFGGHTPFPSPTPGVSYTDQYTQMRYDTRNYFWQWANGVKRTYEYTFLDPAPITNYGSFTQNGWVDQGLNTKPIYTAMTGIIGLLADRGSAFSPTALSYTLTGSTSGLYHVLLQKRDGSYWLALWLGVQSWNTSTGGDVTVTPQTVTLTTTPTFATANYYTSDETGTYTSAAVSGWTGNTGTVSVTDKISLVQLSTGTVATTSQLCVGGTLYNTAADDEFTQDSVLNAGPSPIPNGHMWSTQLGQGIGRTNSYPDDAYYTDSSITTYGYNPFSIGNGNPLTITAKAIASPYPLPSGNGGTKHWLSGALSAAPTSYGYFEVAAEEPNIQGWWPAPLWLEGPGNNNQPPGIQELDVNELFGNALPSGTVQQTEIFWYAEPTPTPAPPYGANNSLYVRNVVSPDPSTTYHTYGALWQPAASPNPYGSVTYYIDRVPTASFPAQYVAPMEPFINLQVFQTGAYAPAPASTASQSMSLTYYRQYQAAAGSCGGAQSLATAVPVLASPSPAATAVAIRTVGPMSMHTGTGNTVGTLATAPSTGDLLIAFVSNDFVSAPTGWTIFGGSSYASQGVNVLYGIVGTSGLTAATSYNFGGTDGNIAQIIDITAGTFNASIAPLIQEGANPVYYGPNTYPINVVMQTSGALSLDAYSAMTLNAGTGVSAFADNLPAGQAVTSIGSLLNGFVSGNQYLSMATNKYTTEVTQGGVPFAPIGSWTSGQGTTVGGAFVTVLPTGVTPAPNPYPSPSYPPTPNPVISPTAGPLTVAPPSLPFSGIYASPQAVSIADPRFTGTFTASVSPGPLASASIVGSGASATMNVSPASPGTGSITVSDGTRSATVAVTVATATPAIIPIPSPSAPIYFGARSNPSGACGASGGAACFIAATSLLESQIGRTLAVNNDYFQWTTLSGISAAATSQEGDDIQQGRYPVIAWNCGDYDSNVGAGIDDTMLHSAADALKAYAQPVFIRWFWEFNLSDSSNSRTACFNPNSGGDGLNSPENIVTPGTVPDTYFSPSEFVAAYRHIHDLFVADGVTNVVWVWCASAGNGGPAASLYYPGDGYVDWLSFDNYDKADNPVGATPSPNPSGLTNTASTMYSTLTAINATKPILWAETGAYPGEQVAFLSGADTTLKTSFPNIKAFMYFDVPGCCTWNLNQASPTPNGQSQFGALGATSYMQAPGPSPQATQTPNPSPTPTVADAVSGSSNTGSVAVTWPNGTPNPNDVLITCAVGQYGQPITPPNNNWQTLYSSTSNFGTGLWWELVGQNEPVTNTWTTGGANIFVAEARISSALGVAPAFTQTSNAGTSITSASIVPTGAGQLPLACFGGEGVTAFSVASGWTQQTQTDGTSYSIMLEQRNTLTTGTGAFTVASTDSGATSATSNYAYTLLVKPATPAPAATGYATIAQTTSFNEQIPLTPLTAAAGSDWAYWGFGGALSAFDRKATGGSTISNYSQVGGSMVGGGGAANGTTLPVISWTSPDGTPDAANPGTTLAQIVNTGGTGTGFSFTATGSTSVSSPKTVLISTGAYCSNESLSVSASDGSFVPVSNIAYTDTLGATPNTMYGIQYATTSPSTVVTFTLTNNNGAICSGVTGSIGLHAAYSVQGAAIIPTPGPALSPSPSPSPTSYPTSIAQTHVHVLLQDICDQSSCYHGDTATSGYTLAQFSQWVDGGESDDASYNTAIHAAGMSTYHYSSPNSQQGLFSTSYELYDGDGNDNCTTQIAYEGYNHSAPLMDISQSAFQTYFATGGYNQNALNTNSGGTPYDYEMQDNANIWSGSYPGQICRSNAEMIAGTNALVQEANKPVILNAFANDTGGPNYIESEGYSEAHSDANLALGMQEKCYSGEAESSAGVGQPAATKNRRITGTEWVQSENTELFLTSLGKSFLCLPENVTNDSNTLGDRMYIEASFLLTFDPAHSWEQAYLCNAIAGSPDDCSWTSTGNFVQIYPEFGLVPLYPIISTPPTTVSALQSGTTGVYYREYGQCYYHGAAIGACASVVNTSSGTQSLPAFAQSYTNTAALSGYGVFPSTSGDQGTMTFAGAPAAQTIPALSAEILVAALPGGSSPSPSPSPSGTPAIRVDPNAIYLGGWINPSNTQPNAGHHTDNVAFEATMGRTLAVTTHYISWSNMMNNLVPNGGTCSNSCLDMQDDANVGRIPLIGWNCNYPNDQIAPGPKHNSAVDSDLAQIASQMKAYARPMFVRYVWEMNSVWSNNSRPQCYDGPQDPASPLPSAYPQDPTGPDGVNGSPGIAGWMDGPTFGAAFNYLIDQLKGTYGVTNVTFLWCPLTGLDGSQWQLAPYYYASHADWNCFDNYNRNDDGISANIDTAPAPIAHGYYGSSPPSIYNGLLGLDPNKPIYWAEDGVHPDTSGAPTNAGQYQDCVYGLVTTGATPSPCPYTKSLATILRAHPNIHGYNAWDASNDPTMRVPPPQIPDYWIIQNYGHGSGWYQFAHDSYMSLPAVPTPAPGSGTITTDAAFNQPVVWSTLFGGTGADWEIFGQTAGAPAIPGMESLNGASILSVYNVIGTTAFGVGSSTPIAGGLDITWAGGTPDSTGGSLLSQVNVAGAGNGYSFTVPGSATPSTTNTVAIIGSGYCAQLQATLHTSDGSFADVVDTSISDSGAGLIGPYLNFQYKTATSTATVTVSVVVSSTVTCSGTTSVAGLRAVGFAPTAVSIPTPGPGPLTLSPSSMTFTAPSSGSQSATISDPNNTGAFSATTSNSAVATALTSGTGAGGTVSVTSGATAGIATITISDGTGATATISVTVNGTSSTCDGNTLTNSASWPATCEFMLGSTNSPAPDRRELINSANPTPLPTELYDSNSQAWIAQEMSFGGNVPFASDIYQYPGHAYGGTKGSGGYADGGFGEYVCNQNNRSECVQVYVRCNFASGSGVYCGNPYGYQVNVSAWVPINAMHQGGTEGDFHMEVVDCISNSPTCNDIEMYNVTTNPPYSTGTVINTAGAGNWDPVCGDGWATGSPCNLRGTPVSVVGNSVVGGMLRVSELANGINGIQHTLSFAEACGSGQGVTYPAQQNAINDPCGSGATGVPGSQRLYWDDSCTTIAGYATDDASKAILCALHTYGAYPTDTVGCCEAFQIDDQENEQEELNLGYTNTIGQYWSQHGTQVAVPSGGNSSYGNFYTAALSAQSYGGAASIFTPSFVEQHLHVLKACVNTQAHFPSPC